MKRFNNNDSRGRFSLGQDDSFIFFNNPEPFFIDKLKILNSKALRRLQFKTQVYHEPWNKHVRSRLIHTNEVMSYSSLMARSLGLNHELCEAIAIGHDLGHFPYGHLIEQSLTSLLREETGNDSLKIHHPLLSVIITQLIERKGCGLNLSYETLEGILNHSRDLGRMYVRDDVLPEYNVVMYADKICYLFSDYNDAVRMGNITQGDEIIHYCAEWFGSNQRERVAACIKSLIDESELSDYVCFNEVPDPEVLSEMKKARTLKELKDVIDDVLINDFMVFDLMLSKMYSNVYPRVNRGDLVGNVKPILTVFKEATISDYKRACDQLYYVECEPDPYLMTSLLTDFDVERLISNDPVTLSKIINLTQLGEIIPYSLRESICHDEMVNLYSIYGEYHGERKSGFFNEVMSPYLRKHLMRQPKLLKEE